MVHINIIENFYFYLRMLKKEPNERINSKRLHSNLKQRLDERVDDENDN